MIAKLLFLVSIILSFAYAYEVCGNQDGTQYYCEDGYGCCSTTTCGLNCSGGKNHGFPRYGYALMVLGVVFLLIISLKFCLGLRKKSNKNKIVQRQKPLLQV
ncbi:transmembrane protein, putative (macronuclear) [Tetrahymena thermophila SB210]|uniref:Transmembrane protein, putative n=1 Tax=Tetrahymena thermophila (strain SB210) TaxID=312017 RepID=Q239H6_TETTS|nr:transmembrane protein, putative [Tetrahymena thermophila SB210]EAR93183.1 transmembrane protein, putative [Tetrahymena thermophila SB210]|eukprot:XP_001013428.1 transmembrane protein, putative [Tetrahymena thermophila SB210]